MSDSLIVDKVKQRIGDLEQAIHRLDFVKRHLNQNSSEVKSQIHTSISRHLETLRNREVWLLEQVDTVLGGKEEVLHRQQARLNKALGILHSSLSHAADSDDEAAARHLVQALEQLNTTELKAGETPYIAFRADQVSLRESIMSYGRVDANGMPFLSAFADEDTPSASLPRHLEEYEDSEHHVFYKTLQDGKAYGSNIKVTVPKLSSHVEGWLPKPMQLSTSAAGVQIPTPEMVGTPVSQTSCSIQNWLSQIKHNPDLEEDDDFEIVDHSGSSQRESPVDEEMKPVPLVEQEDHVDFFHHIPRDIRQWLLSTESSNPVEEDLHAFFKHIPRDTSMWLVTARRQLESLEDLKRAGGWFHHIPTDTSTWLRRAHDKRALSSPLSTPDMFAHISHDKTAWLKCNEPKVEEMDTHEPDGCPSVSDEGKKLTGIPFQFPAPLSSIPDVMKEYLASTPKEQESWLLLPEEGMKSGVGFGDTVPTGFSLPGIQRYLKGNMSNNNIWLAIASKEEERVSQLPKDAVGFFSHISRKKSDWLRDVDAHSRKGSPSPSCAIDLKNVIAENGNEWLKEESPYPALTSEKSLLLTAASPVNSLRQSFGRMTTSDWLLGGERHSSDTPVGSEKSWTVCSSESSLSSASSLQSVMSPCQGTAVDLTTWIYQK